MQLMESEVNQAQEQPVHVPQMDPSNWPSHVNIIGYFDVILEMGYEGLDKVRSKEWNHG